MDWNPGLIAAVSVIVTGMLALIQLRGHERRAKRAHTLTLMGTLSHDKSLTDAHYIVHQMQSEGETDLTVLEDEEKKGLFTLLTYYEYIATAYFADSVDRGVVLRQRAKSLEMTYHLIRPLIEERRVALKAPDLYNEFEELATKEVARYRRRPGTGRF